MERDATKLLQKVDPGAKLPKPISRKKKDEVSHDKEHEDSHESEDENSHDERENSHDESEGEGGNGVELFFEDENGVPVDEVKSFLEKPSHVEDSLHRIKEKVEKKDGEESECSGDEEEYNIRDNSLPPEIEEGEITLGIVYVLIDIRSFFKIVSTYEDDLINFYSQIEDNEEDMKQKNLLKVKELCNNLILHSEKKLKEISEEEGKLKDHLVRLTIVLTQANCLRDKFDKNPKKYGIEIIEETNRIHQETRDTIYKLNMEILKLRDSSEELLSNYVSSIQELLEL